MNCTRRRAFGIFAAVVVLLAIASGMKPAPASPYSGDDTSGGASVATAPPVVPGVEYQSDLGGTGRYESYPAGYWKVSLTVGDGIAVVGLAVTGETVALFGPGLSDANVGTAIPVATGALEPGEGTQAGLAGVLAYTATSSGWYTMVVFAEGSYGPYEFVVGLRRAAVLHVDATITTRTNGRLRVRVLTPVGSPITDTALTVTLQGIWTDTPSTPPTAHLLARGHPVDGRVTLRFALPSRLVRSTVALLVSASSPRYQRVQHVICRATVI